MKEDEMELLPEIYDKPKKKKKEKNCSAAKPMEETEVDSVDSIASNASEKKKEKKSRVNVIKEEIGERSINMENEAESEEKRQKKKKKSRGERDRAHKKSLTESIGSEDCQSSGKRKERKQMKAEGVSYQTKDGGRVRAHKKEVKKEKIDNSSSLFIDSSKKKRKKTEKKDEGVSNKAKDGGKVKAEKKKSGKYSKNSQPEETSRRVSFSGEVEMFPPSDDSDVETYDENNLVRGKRFSPKEDQLISDAVNKYIETNQLGEDGLHMVLRCSRFPQVKDCWKEICASLPWRPYAAVYGRAHTIFERSENRGFTAEEKETIRRFHAEYGPQWKKLSEVLGKQRMHIKDAWRRIRLPNEKRGYWSQDEYQTLFDLVNLDLRMKAFEERKSDNCMIRENISWEAISDKLTTRTMSSCCHKWYDQLTSPLVREGVWTDGDDYRLLEALQKQDACNVEDVEWDSLLERRSGEVCRRRWHEMVRHIGGHKERSFLEQLDVLTMRYCAEMLPYREPEEE